MAKRTSLREFQSQLSARLNSAQRGETTNALLGVASGQGDAGLWLLDLSDSGEVAPLPAEGITPVALTKPWFAGVVNIRGMLFSVVDFAAFRGLEPTPRGSEARLVMAGMRHGVNSALLVDRTLGLRAPASLTLAAEPAAGAPAWVGRRYHDEHGRPWTRLRFGALLASPDFLDVAA